MIWIIGGTTEAIKFLQLLENNTVNNCGNNLERIVSVASDYSLDILKEINYKGEINVGKMDYDEMLLFIKEKNIHKIIDLSHPYAQIVSTNAIRCSKESGIPYYFCRRETLHSSYGNVEYFKTIDDIVEKISTLKGNILNTLGSNTVEKFSQLENLNNIYFRVLPDYKILEILFKLNIPRKNIIAIQGPFSQEMNIALINQYGIKYVISKCSGENGGEKEKVIASEITGCKMLLLERPEIPPYGFCFKTLEELSDDIKKNQIEG